MRAEDLRAEREACVSSIDSLLLTRAWAFEFSPASSDAADDTYLEKVDQCDIFIMILGSELTDPVEREYARAWDRGKPRLLFVKDVEHRTVRAEEWLRRRSDVKWARFDGATDLADHIRASVSDELVRAHRRLRLKDSDFESIAAGLRSQPVTFIVRTIESSELAHVTATLPELQARYPRFSEWVEGRAVEIAKGTAEAYVASIGGETAGFALVADKEPQVRKISTLFIGTKFRGQGVGPRLLFGIVERAARDKVEKLYITVADELREQLEPLLVAYGFFIEGASGRRYRQGSWEWIWSKRLLYGRLRRGQLPKFVEYFMFRERGFEAEDFSRSQFLARERYGVLGQPDATKKRQWLVATATEDRPDARYHAARKKAETLGLPLVFVSVEPLVEPHDYGICLDGLDLEARFFPLYIEGNVEGLLIPIRQAFAQMLIPRSEEPQFLVPTRVQLRTDNVYYRYPSGASGLRRGSPLFFFETERGQSESRLIGEARLLEFSIDQPEDLLAEYGNLGVYTLDDVRTCTVKRGRNAGKALALRFDWYREIPVPLTRQQIQKILPTFNARTARRLQPMDILELRRLVGWNVDVLSLP